MNHAYADPVAKLLTYGVLDADPQPLAERRGPATGGSDIFAKELFGKAQSRSIPGSGKRNRVLCPQNRELNPREMYNMFPEPSPQLLDQLERSGYPLSS